MSIRYKKKRRERYYRFKAWGSDDEQPFPTEPCWCGEAKPYYAPLPMACGGSGTIDCHCGGDQCVCHWHGEVECFGCEDCNPTYDDRYDEADDPEEDRIYFEK